MKFWDNCVSMGRALAPKRMSKQGLGKGTLGTLIFGIIGLVVIVSVYNDNSANFTGLTGTVMGFFTVLVAVGLIMKALRS